MSTYVQADRPLSVNTPLGPDKLLLVGFRGHDAVSQLFAYHLDLLAENKTDVAFDKLLGQKITVTFRWGEKRDKKRYFNGVCIRAAQAGRDETFTRYGMELVPQFWLLTRKAQSRIFQHMSVPDILKKVLVGIDVTWEIKGTFEPRDFCVQYRETDYNFASRLMEEEGIYYFFKHVDGNHTMVVANTPQSHPDVTPQSNVVYETALGGERPDLRVSTWAKAQELRSGKYTLWDHSFELPHKHLEAEKTIQDSVSAGSVSHKLKVGGNEKFEIYDFPGEYAQRFDGIDKGGGDKPADLQKIFEDNKRTIDIRMQQEALPSLEIDGESNCRQFVAGHTFTLEKHFNADGKYVLTNVAHTMIPTGADYRSGGGSAGYSNVFRCIPMGLPFRPPRLTPKPVVQGTQSAVVVGPQGEEIFTDKYGRVKVQFHWDREGKHNADSSCWLRVTSPWAGKQWGMVHIPRIGQEVIVDFLEGDPDQPIILGSVYNADMMPPYQLPANKTQSGAKSRSSLDGSPENFNEIRFEDKKGHEQVYIHAEKNQDISVENDETHSVGSDRTKTIGNNEQSSIGKNRTESVGKNESITIGEARTESVGKDETISIGENRSVSVGKEEKLTVNGGRTQTIYKDETLTIQGKMVTTIAKDAQVQVGKTFALIASDQVQLQSGDASLILKKNGDIVLNGKDVKISASGKISLKASSDISLKGSKVSEN